MARYAIELLNDDNRLRKMAQRARAVAIERFSAMKIVKQYEDFYLRVLERSA
jgi:glycosyltransferase involved in cell wall biosynthesis